jgi:uncharacterized protein
VLSIDTNILLYAYNRDCQEHEPAFAFLTACSERDDVALCELVLVELYILLRNPTVIAEPLSAQQAAEACGTYRRHPRWRLVENAPVMDRVWTMAGQPEFARRRIFDARIALTLIHHGVNELATANSKHFDDFGFSRVWNPLAQSPE